MKVRHIKSVDVWLLSKGNRILYRGPSSPWKFPDVIEAALRRDARQGRPATLESCRAVN